MLKGTIHVDLPSAETERKKNAFDHVKSFFGGKLDLASGREELTVSALNLVEGLVASFRGAGVTNAIAFLVDKQVVYQDVHDEKDDLALIVTAALGAGILERKFQEMHLVLTHTEQGIHTIFDVRVANAVVLGQAEMTVTCAGRIEALRIQPGETAAAYAERVKAFATHEGAGEAWRLAFHALVERAAQSLQKTLVGSRVWTDSSVIELIRPSQKQVGHFRKLEFGSKVKPPTYRAVPTRQREGAYADPFYYYYYDPYYDFTSWVLLDSLLCSSHWHHHTVHVVDPAGKTLFFGDDAADHAGALYDVKLGASSVGFDPDGGLIVDASVPVAVSDPSADDLLPSGGSDAGFVDADVSGGDLSPLASCGSSCSTCSSCGSSCGGCGGCS